MSRTDYGYDILIAILVKPLAHCAFTHLPIRPNLKTVYFPRCDEAKSPPPHFARAHEGGGAFFQRTLQYKQVEGRYKVTQKTGNF